VGRCQGSQARLEWREWPMAVTSVHNDLSGLYRHSGRDDVRRVGDKSWSVRAHGSIFSTPGFTPGSLPVLLPIPGPTQSHSITLVQTDLLIVSTRTSFMVSLHLTLSLSPLIALLRRRRVASSSISSCAPPTGVYERSFVSDLFKRTGSHSQDTEEGM
jgi:hypothetical protein